MLRLSPKSLALVFGVLGLIVGAAVFYLRQERVLKEVTHGEDLRPEAGGSTTIAPVTSSGKNAAAANATSLAPMVSAMLGTETEPAVKALANDLLTGGDDQRAAAIGELGFLDDPRWTPVVVRVLAEDASATVRSAAAATLATQSSSPAAVHALTEALLDGDPDVREDALLSLKAIRSSVVEQDLRQMLTTMKLDADTTRDVRLFLDHYYLQKDPLADPLGN